MALRRELLKAAMLAAALLVLLPAAAMAAPQWLGAEPLDPGFVSTSTGPDVTTDANGNSAAVWIGSGGEVNAAVRPSGGPWGTPENLEPAGQVDTADGPLVIAEPGGEFVAVWVRNVGETAGDEIRWAHTLPGGDWSPPDSLGQTLTNAAPLALEVGAAGDATVLWRDIRGNTNTRTKPAGSDTWEASDSLPNVGTSHLALTVSADGGSVVAYPATCNDVSFFDCVLARYRPKGGNWSADSELAGSAAGNVTGIALVARPDSSYTVTWGEDTQPPSSIRSQNPPGAVRSADRAPGLSPSWSQQTVTVLPADAAGCPSNALGCIDLASRGDQLAAVWQQGGGEGGEIEASVRTGDGAWGARERVGNVGSAGDAFPQVALTANGTAVAAWGDGPSGSAVARASHRTAGGTWSATEIGTPAEGSALLRDVVADDLGDAVTAWREPGGVQAAGFDGAGPRFSPTGSPGSFSVPATGTAGQPLTFSASVDDNWSDVTNISWLFGDGGSAGGGTVTHAYGAAGVFTATATATDSAGNTSQRSGTTTIAAAPDPCGTTDRDKDGIKDACDTNDGSKRPVPFKTVNATVVSGDVFIKLPAGAARAAQGAKPPKGFVRLQGANTIPVGSTLDTAKGRVALRSASDTRGHVQRGEFFRGRFVVRQVRKPRGKAKRRSTKLITVLTLSGSSFSKTCRPAKASTSARRRSRKRVRRLFGDARGSFRSKGRNAAATVRGTRWSVQDRCDGTLVTVQRGRVSVRDLVRHRTVLVKTGHTYLARRR